MYCFMKTCNVHDKFLKTKYLESISYYKNSLNDRKKWDTNSYYHVKILGV